jgi:heat shock protein HslJ
MEGEPMVGLDRWYWRLLLGLPMVPAAAQLVLFKWRVTVDPPSFLVNSGQITEARSLLYETYGLQPPVADAPAELGNSAAAKVELILSEMVDACTQARAIPRLHIHQAVCDPFLRCALFLGFALAAFQQLSGINALMSYSNTLFSQAGISDNHLTLASTIMATANVCVSFLSSSVVDHWGRRKLLLLGSLLQAAAMLAITAAGVPGLLFLPSSTLGPLVLFCFSLFVVSFSAGLGAVTWLYLSEIYPMEIRGSALSACGVINWLSCFLVVFGARFLSLHSSCRLFGMVCGFGAVGVYLWVVETKGCNMEDSPLTPRSLRSTSSLLQATPQEDPGGELKMTVERT